MKPLTGLDKVALVLKSLGPKAVDVVLAKLGPEHSERVRTRMQQLPPEAAAPETLEQLLREAAQALAATAAAAPAAEPPAAATPQLNLVVSETAEEAEPEPVLSSDPLQAIRQLPVPALATALQGESSRTVSLVLSLLETAPAGDVYKRLPVTLRREVSLQFASQPMPPAPVLKRVAEGIVHKTQALKAAPATPAAGDRIRNLASFLRLVDRTERTEVLTAVEAKDAEMARQIKELLYQFEDLVLIENLSLQKLLAELDTQTLATALKGSTPAIQHKVLTNLSKRAQDALNEEIALLGNVAKSRVEQARQTIADIIRRLDERGELTMLE